MEDVEVAWVKSVGEWRNLERGPVISLDLETTSLDISSAGISAVSWAFNDKRGYVSSFGPAVSDYLNTLARSVDRIITHNGMNFDLPILDRHDIVLPREKSWDTMLSAYVLGRDLGLKTRALRELGILMETYDRVSGGEKDSSRVDPWMLFPYAATDAVVPLLLYEKDRREVKDRNLWEAINIEHELSPIFVEMQVRGIAFDRVRAIELQKELGAHIEEVAERAVEQAGVPFNLNKPEDVSWVLFDRLKIPPVKKTKGGEWSTDESVLKARIENHPVVSTIMEYRQWHKQKSTYIDSPIRLSENDGRLHTVFKQFGARGGRSSSEHPNLQNIPQRRGWDKKIKALYLPDEGCELWSFDYNQLEMRVAAAITEDPELMRIFIEDRDIHSENIVSILGRRPGNPDDRRLSKNIGFGLMYGLSARGLNEYLLYRAEPPIALSMKEIVRIRSNFLRRFSVLAEVQEDWRREVDGLGYVDTPVFRYRRYLPEVFSGDAKYVSEAERVAVNLKIQGPAGVITKLAMVRLRKYRELFRNTVHDQVLASIPVKWGPVVSEEIAREMVRTGEEVLGIPVKVAYERGRTWAECK